jgi:rubredoxin
MLRRCLRGFGFRPKRVDTMVPHCSERCVDVSEPRTWMCLICGWIYDEAAGDPEHGLPPGTAWSDVPMNWTCPECGARKEDFEMVQI